MKKVLLSIKKRPGVALLEIILSVAVLSLLITAFTGVYFYGEGSAATSGKRARATLLAQEGLEAVRSIRDGIYQGNDNINGANGFMNLQNGVYGLTKPGDGGTWILSGTSDTTDVFTRHIDITDCDIPNPNCKKIRSVVDWKQDPYKDGTISLETSLTNWVAFRVQCGNGTIEGNEECDDGNQDDGDGCNSACLKPNTCNDVCQTTIGCNGGFSCINGYCRNPLCTAEASCFCPSCGDGGCNHGETCSSCPMDCGTCGGGNGVGDWSAPHSIASVNLSPWYTYYDKWKVQLTGNFIFVVRTVWYPHFVAVNVIDPSKPIVTGQKTLIGTQVNLFNTDTYSYVASSWWEKEMQILDITKPSQLPLVANYNAPGLGTSLGVFVKGVYAYLTKYYDFWWNEFVIVDVSNPSRPTTKGSLKLNCSGYDVYVSGNYAYVATDSDSRELQVINVTNPSSPSYTTVMNFSGTEDAISLAGSGNILLVGTRGYTDYIGKMHIIDISNPASPTLISTFDAQGIVQDIDFGNQGKYAFIVTSNPNKALQVIDISNTANPTLVGSYKHSGKLHGVEYSDTQDRVYAVGESRSNEFMVIAPR